MVSTKKNRNGIGLCIIVFVGIIASATSQSNLDSIQSMHDTWAVQHNKMYKSADEKAHRFKVFKDNVEFINKANEKKAGYTLAVNQFADLTGAEFKAMFLSDVDRATVPPPPPRNPPPPAPRPPPPPPPSTCPVKVPSPLPDFVDWQSKGAVTPVINQKQCGSCWSFAATGALEGAHKIKTGNLINLSEQSLLDCDIKGINNGCNGGLAVYAYEWVKNNGGLTSAAMYPYKGVQGVCNKTLASAVVTKIIGFDRVQPNNETALKIAVARQPISVSVAAGSSFFQFYKSGILSNGGCGFSVDHEVVATGYGTENGVNYWRMKNTWGPGWGEAGYFRILRGYSDPRGICGVAIRPSFPIPC